MLIEWIKYEMKAQAIFFFAFNCTVDTLKLFNEQALPVPTATIIY